jgi:F-type H+-transporting ATPase subunit delta
MAAFAARYARAFAEVLEAAQISPQEAEQQLSDFLAAMAESRDLREVLSNPAMSVEARVRVVDALAARLKLRRETRNFLAVVLRHERMRSLGDIVAHFRAEIDRREGVSPVEITTARPLSAGERREMEDQAARLAGSKVRARFDEDRALIGGAVMRIGGTVYDGSVRGRLARLKDELVAG